MPQEAMVPTDSDHLKLRWEQLLKDHAALLKDEVFGVILGTVNMQHGTAFQSKRIKSGRDTSNSEVSESDFLSQVPDTPIADSSNWHRITLGVSS